MIPLRVSTRLAVGLLGVALLGCGTTRMTDSPRAATEMLLVSQAADNAVAQIDFSPLAEKRVYLDASGVPEQIADKGYLVSLIKQQLVAGGALLQDDKTRADYVVELRVGGLGTDRHSLLIGSPAVSLPSVMPGIPTNIPEIALVKKNDQRGVAKVAVFAYSRITGRAVWQSGTVEAMSHAKDTWLFGAGPFSSGSIRRRTELAGEPLPTLPNPLPPLLSNHSQEQVNSAITEQYFPNYETPPPPPVIPASLLGLTGAAAVGGKAVAR
jgi:hypothetical protein